MTLRAVLSSQFRARRAALLRNVIKGIGEGRRGISILDIGGRLQYWDSIGIDVLWHYRANVTLLNLRPEELEGPGSDIFKTVVGNGCNLNFEEDQFDLVHSNSVIEHVETWRNMKAFAAETRRVGRNYFVQTPYFWFPIDPHFYAFPMFHWFPPPIRARLVSALPLAQAGRMHGVDKSFQTVDGVKLLDTSQMRFLFPDAELLFERFAGIPKSMTAIRLAEY